MEVIRKAFKGGPITRSTPNRCCVERETSDDFCTVLSDAGVAACRHLCGSMLRNFCLGGAWTIKPSAQNRSYEKCEYLM